MNEALPPDSPGSSGCEGGQGVGRTGSQPAPSQGPEGGRGPGLVVLWSRDQAFTVSTQPQLTGCEKPAHSLGPLAGLWSPGAVMSPTLRRFCDCLALFRGKKKKEKECVYREEQ